MDIKLKENERIDDLEYKGLKIIQNENGFCFGMDAVLLSHFAKNSIRKNDKILDIGTGTGIIGILLCAKTEASQIVGIEIQNNVADMAKRSIELNNMQDKFTIINDDLKEMNKYFNNSYFDVIVSNPPYKQDNTGLKNDSEEKIISRHEVKCDLEDVIMCASKMLKDKGSFHMVHRPERLKDILCTLNKYKLEPKEIRFVHPKANKKPNLILIKSVKNSRPFLNIQEPLYVYGEDGSYTQEILEIYERKEK